MFSDVVWVMQRLYMFCGRCLVVLHSSGGGAALTPRRFCLVEESTQSRDDFLECMRRGTLSICEALHLDERVLRCDWKLIANSLGQTAQDSLYLRSIWPWTLSFCWRSHEQCSAICYVCEWSNGVVFTLHVRPLLIVHLSVVIKSFCGAWAMPWAMRFHLGKECRPFLLLRPVFWMRTDLIHAFGSATVPLSPSVLHASLRGATVPTLSTVPPECQSMSARWFGSVYLGTRDMQARSLLNFTRIICHIDVLLSLYIHIYIYHWIPCRMLNNYPKNADIIGHLRIQSFGLTTFGIWPNSTMCLKTVLLFLCVRPV